jgi:cytochrome c peroxidase
MKLRILSICAISIVALAWLEQVGLPYPAYFPEPAYDFTKNPLDSASIELGRVLFYDPILSRDSSVSCASCHSPYNAFAHTDHDLSHGIDDQIGTRNAPALYNLAWHNTFMWDGAINHLDMQALAPISHPKEMDESIANITKKLSNTKLYPRLFGQVFDDNSITGERVLKALAQFQLSLVSANAKYDAVKQGRASFSPQEAKGYALFQQHCNSCHREPLFSTYGFANNGLAPDTSLNDWGRYKTTQNPSDSLLFKIPSLRNLSYSFPYMHDGRFKKLNQVLNHYSSGIVQSPSLSPLLQQGLTLSSSDKVDIIAFLLTLDDRDFVFDPKHQFPKNILLPAKD